MWRYSTLNPYFAFEQNVFVPHNFKVPLMLNSNLFISLQEVFPVQYGTKFDTALQALTAGLVCKLEQVLPVPNLSQVRTCTWHFDIYSYSSRVGYWLGDRKYLLSD